MTRLGFSLLCALLGGCGPSVTPSPEPPPRTQPSPTPEPEAGHAHGNGHGHSHGNDTGHGHSHANDNGNEHAGPPAEHPHHDAGPQHRFQDAQRWVQIFDDPKRDAWQKPDDVIRELHIKADATVADLGAGTGYFTVRLSKALPQGRVIAIDLEQDMVTHIRERARKAGLSNVSAHVAAADDPKLPSGVDVMLVVDTYHHLTNRAAYMRRVRQQLGPTGRVVIVDFRMGKLPVGPPDSHKLPPSTVRREMKEAGFTECGEYTGLPHQYMITFAERCSPDPGH